MSAPYVIPDIAPFKANTGKVIEGRRQWKEHLKETGSVELGKQDLAEMQSVHEKKRQEIREKVEQQTKVSLKTDWEEPKDIEKDPHRHKRFWAKVAERLDGRDPPSRRQLLRIVVEECKRSKR